MAIAQVERLTYWYPGQACPALNDVDLQLDAGLTVVAGPSGGGKSTLLRVLNGLVPHFHGGRISGRASAVGHDILTTPSRTLARSVGFVFQDPELQTVYGTVEREIAFGLENTAVPQREISTRVHAAMHEVGIEHLAGRLVATLSGGERQRLALSSALAMRPAIVALDEPTSQLDPDGASLFLHAAQSAAGDGRAVVVSEHRLRRLAPAADRMIKMEDGRLDVVDRTQWRQPLVTPPPRAYGLGEEAWALRRVAAGFAGKAVVEDIEIAGGAGEVVAMAGPNGSGKTTLLRTIAGLMAPLSGEVSRRPGRVAYLPQNPVALLHRPSVRQEVQFTVDRAGENDESATARILDLLGIGRLAGRYPRDLSSGERQRAALAAVLPGMPSLVLLDEPTRGMDHASRVALINVVAALRDGGAAIVIATHDEDLQAALADRVVKVGS